MPRRTLLVVAAATAVLVTAGCTQAPVPTPSASSSPIIASPSPSSAAPTPTPTPTKIPSFEPAPASEAPEVGAVREAWQTYMNVLDRHYKDPQLTDFSDLTAITTGTEGARAMASITRMRDHGVKRVGDAIFRDVKISAPAANADGVTTSTVTYCFDPSQIEANYEQAPTTTLLTVDTLELMPDGSWRAAASASEKKPC